VPPQTARRTHARTTVAPRHARRVSGPARSAHVLRGVAGVPAALPAGRTAARPRPRQSPSVFERLSRVADHRLVDGLLRSRAWIVIVGVLLGGIVAMQVSLLKLNSGITRAVQASATLERQNADMQARIATLSSAQRVSATATGDGMVFPPAGEVTYLRARPGHDAPLAARRMSSPSASAAAVMAAGGHAAATTTTSTTAATTTTPSTTASGG
jgi:cell division protein FtsL